VILVLTVLGMAAGYLTAKPARATNPLQSPTTAAPDVYSAAALLMPIAPSGVSQGVSTFALFPSRPFTVFPAGSGCWSSRWRLLGWWVGGGGRW